MAFGLNVDAVKAKDILVDHAIHAPISRLAKTFGRVLVRAPVSHRDQKIDDQALEEARIVLEYSVEEFLAQLSQDSCVSSIDGFLGCPFGIQGARGRVGNFRRPGRACVPLREARFLQKKIPVDLDGLLVENRLPAGVIRTYPRRVDCTRPALVR